MIRIAFLGYGTVNRALHALLQRRAIEHVVTGVATRQLGWRANAEGLDPAAPNGMTCGDVATWLDAARPDVVCEAIALDPHAGQPALDYVRAALTHGAHVVSANKGPVVHAWRALAALAEQHGRAYRFEAAVMDGVPVFSLARECLPLAGLRGVRGVFTSTATVVLEAIENGGSLDDGIAHAQRLGIAEADPSYDVDGWDSAVKLCAIANVLLGADVRPDEVLRDGIRALDPGAIRRAREAGTPYKLVGDVWRDPHGIARARVGPVQIAPGDPLAAAHGTSLVIHWDAEVFPGGLTVTSHDPDPTTTAYGMLADLVHVMRL